jgi:hypothetical protein
MKAFSLTSMKTTTTTTTMMMMMTCQTRTVTSAPLSAMAVLTAQKPDILAKVTEIKFALVVGLVYQMKA